MKKKIVVEKNGEKVVITADKPDSLKSIAQELLNFAQDEILKILPARTEVIFHIHDLAHKLQAMGHNPTETITRMRKKGYLRVKTKDPEVYYIFTIPGQGQRLAKHLDAK